MVVSLFKRPGNFSSRVIKCIRKFTYYFPRGFEDTLYHEWERGYKWAAHERWQALLNKTSFQNLLAERNYQQIAKLALAIEFRTNLLFSFEKMALRDAVKTDAGAKTFATGLFEYVYGAGSVQQRFEGFSEVVQSLPRKQTKVHSWPVLTVFGFIGDPLHHIFLKPRVTQAASISYGYDFQYKSFPNWDTYKSLLGFCKELKKSLAGLQPRDNIDIQSFIWVLGSDEYPW